MRTRKSQYQCSHQRSSPISGRLYQPVLVLFQKRWQGHIFQGHKLGTFSVQSESEDPARSSASHPQRIFVDTFVYPRGSFYGPQWVEERGLFPKKNIILSSPNGTSNCATRVFGPRNFASSYYNEAKAIYVPSI